MTLVRGCVLFSRNLSMRQPACAGFVDVARGFIRRALYPQDPTQSMELVQHSAQHRNNSVCSGLMIWGLSFVLVSFVLAGMLGRVVTDACVFCT
jgi:hypothetical protein